MAPQTEDPRAGLLRSEWTMMMNWCVLISMCPVDKWLEDLEHSEVVAPFIDPMLFIDYMHSGKGAVIKKVFRAALEMKRTIEEIKPQLAEIMAKESRR